MSKIDANLKNISPLKARRRELRNNPTPAEALLWSYIRRRQLLGKKFRRQYSVGRFVLDFFCTECGIAIELDGAPHYRELREEYEAERTVFLKGLGIELLRFENRVVRENVEMVLESIGKAIKGKVV